MHRGFLGAFRIATVELAHLDTPTGARLCEPQHVWNFRDAPGQSERFPGSEDAAGHRPALRFPRFRAWWLYQDAPRSSGQHETELFSPPKELTWPFPFPSIA